MRFVVFDTDCHVSYPNTLSTSSGKLVMTSRFSGATTLWCQAQSNNLGEKDAHELRLQFKVHDVCLTFARTKLGHDVNCCLSKACTKTWRHDPHRSCRFCCQSMRTVSFLVNPFSCVKVTSWPSFFDVCVATTLRDVMSCHLLLHINWHLDNIATSTMAALKLKSGWLSPFWKNCSASCNHRLVWNETYPLRWVKTCSNKGGPKWACWSNRLGSNSDQMKESHRGQVGVIICD